jgi:hypothetical protein
MVFFVTEKRNLTMFITKCYYLNLISIAKLRSIINFTNPIQPRDKQTALLYNKDITSAWAKVRHGVPQGFVL